MQESDFVSGASWADNGRVAVAVPRMGAVGIGLTGGRPGSAMLKLVEVTRDNWQECIRMPISEDHGRFVQTNLYSLAQAQFQPGAKVRCLCAGDVMVGCALFGPDEHRADLFWIYRLMVSERERRKGHGRAGLALIMDEARRLGYARIGLSADPDNWKAIDLYVQMGFRATGEMDGRERIYVCSLRQEPGGSCMGR